MEGPVSSADPQASSLDSLSAVNRKITRSEHMQRSSAVTAVLVQKHSFAEIFSHSSVAVALNGVCLSCAAEMTARTGTDLFLYG